MNRIFATPTLWIQELPQGILDWARLEGDLKFVGKPAVVLNRVGGIEVFARGADGALYRKLRHGFGWASLGGLEVIQGNPGDSLGSANPVVAMMQNGLLVVLTRSGVDNTLWHAWQHDDGTWSGWYRISDQVCKSDPAVVLNGDGRLEGFVISDRGTLWRFYLWIDEHGEHHWTPGWDYLGKPAHGFAAAAIPVLGLGSTGTGSILLDVYVRGADNEMYVTRYNQKRPDLMTWESLGGSFLSDPAVALYSNSSTQGFDIFVRGSDNSIQQADMSYSTFSEAHAVDPVAGPVKHVVRFSGWSPHNVLIESICTPAAVQFSGDIHVFATASDKTLRRLKIKWSHSSSRDSGVYGNLVLSRGPIASDKSDPVAIVSGVGFIHLYAVDLEGAIWEWTAMSVYLRP